MNLNQRIEALHQLGEKLRQPESDDYLVALMQRTEFNNGWFTLENQLRAARAIGENYLVKRALTPFAKAYFTNTAPARRAPKTVGLVLAGNIPLVGMHDIVCTFLAGQRAQIKLSGKDPYVLPYLLKQLEADEYFDVSDKLSGFDAVIATGSNNSARYFEAYFGKYPNIIRRGRNAVAVLTGEETREELRRLGDDIFSYFGLGCRNVSKLYVPKNYDFTPLLEVLHKWRGYQNHPKWKNNFDYHYALYTLNREKFMNNGALLVRENEALASHIAGLYYEYYDGAPGPFIDELMQTRVRDIQLIVARPPVPSECETFDFGEAQQPKLTDFADGVDTMAFLAGL